MKARVNGVEINYEIEGSGPWVTLSHSLACNLHMWDEQMDVLTKKYRVLRFDTRGHGGSSTPAGAYTFDQMSDDVQGLLAALGIERTHWIGLSMGGMIGQTFALRCPDVLQSLVLADTASHFPAEAASMFASRIKIAEANGMQALTDLFLERWFTEPYRSSHPQVNERIGGYIRSTPVAGYVGCSHAIPRINLTHRLQKIKCPTLVVVGEQDPATPVAMAREIHDALPSSELVIIPSAKHLSNIEQSQTFNATVLDFLDRSEAKNKVL